MKTTNAYKRVEKTYRKSRRLLGKILESDMNKFLGLTTKRDNSRINIILKYLKYYWKKNPDLRLCQLIVNIAQYYQAEKPRDIYYVEDEILLTLLKKLCRDDLIEDALRKRKATEKIERDGH